MESTHGSLFSSILKLSTPKLGLSLIRSESTSLSDACISAINSYYHQVLSYGRNRVVILEAPIHDPRCVLANIFAAYYYRLTHAYRLHLPGWLHSLRKKNDFSD